MSTQRYGIVRASLWSASRKWKALRGDDDARLLYFYLLTCPHRNSVGCYILPREYAVIDLCWTEPRLADALDSLAKVRLIAYDSNEDVVRIIDSIKQDGPKNPSAAKGMLDAALSLPDCREKAECLWELAFHRHATKGPTIQNTIRDWFDWNPHLVDGLTPPPRHSVDTVSRPSGDDDRTVSRHADTSPYHSTPHHAESIPDQSQSSPADQLERDGLVPENGYAVWELYQETLTAEGHATRPTPPAPTDIAVADKWLEAGASVTIIRSAFRHGIQKVAERQGQPPSRLKYFNGMIREALTIRKETPASGRADAGMSSEELADARAKNYIAMVEAGREAWWDPEWGDRPDVPDVVG